MRFAYTYRSSDGERHSAEIEAESRDAAFARLRAEMGIKPIKVVAAVCQGQDTQDNRDKWHFPVPGVAVVAAFLALSALLAFGAWWWLRRAGDDAPYQVMTPQGPVTLSVAATLPRQMIPGDRRRIENARGEFRHAAEAWLARYAEPGRKIEGLKIEDLKVKVKGEEAGGRPEDGEFEECLKEPIRIASTDFTETVDLKRIVAGMKREMRAYLTGGGTVREYCAEVEKRQRLEISYRENAERKLAEMLSAREDSRPPEDSKRSPLNSSLSTLNSSLSAAYAYWLKANAQLQSMGIYPLPLPDALRDYQTGLDIEE